MFRSLWIASVALLSFVTLLPSGAGASSSPDRLETTHGTLITKRLLIGSLYPNPMRAHKRIVFQLPTPQWVRLEVRDGDDRLVKTVAEGQLGAGTHIISWDGTDTWGRLAGAGIYACELGTFEGPGGPDSADLD